MSLSVHRLLTSFCLKVVIINFGAFHVSFSQYFSSQKGRAFVLSIKRQLKAQDRTQVEAFPVFRDITTNNKNQTKTDTKTQTMKINFKLYFREFSYFYSMSQKMENLYQLI